jgi:pyrroline-5-carboxylate reductase
MSNKTIAFLGAGTMATSMIGGLIADHYPAKNLWASNINKDKLADLAAKYSINIAASNVDAADKADVIILAAKPPAIISICREIKSVVQNKNPLVISIAAGITTETLERCLSRNADIVRCMPNMPALLGCGITGLYAPARVLQKMRDQAESILRSVGVTEWVLHEHLLDVITAISGSGPAYYFYLMEILQKEAIHLGLPAKTARLFSIQTALGAARLALESNAEPETLRKQVTSVGGTTEAAMKVLMEKDISGIFVAALNKAKERSKELGAQYQLESNPSE